MSWLPESIINSPPSGSEYGLIVRPIFSGSDPNVLSVNIANPLSLSGSLLITGPVTGSVSLSEPITGSVKITEPIEITFSSGSLHITGSVSLSEPITGSVSLTGPITGSVKLTEPITGSVSITGPITGSVKITEVVQVIGSVTAVITGSSDETRPFADSHSVIGYITTPTIFQLSNTNRRGWSCFNGTNKNLFLRLGVPVSTGTFSVKLIPNSYFELDHPVYTGLITGLWASGGAGNAQVDELVSPDGIFNVFYGSSLVPGAYNAAFVQSLASSRLQQSFTGSYVMGVGAVNKKDYLCWLTSFGDPFSFMANGFTFPMTKVATNVPVVDLGVSGSYDIWESDNFLVPAYTVEVV